MNPLLTHTRDLGFATSATHLHTLLAYTQQSSLLEELAIRGPGVPRSFPVLRPQTLQAGLEAISVSHAYY
jgi:hypothetical protein